MSDTKTQTPNVEKGNISVHTENIFPIIKKSLYSNHEIFLRELVSNAVDASQKIAYLSRTGQFDGEVGELKVSVSIDKEAKTITIADNGIGMTADEIKKYINQVAFSGAEEFVQKFKDVKDTKEIIGQFGLGFYSAFMVAKEVELISKSYQKDTEAARWTCDGTTSYTLEPGEKEERGTTIILHVAEDSEEFLETQRLQHILDKYCKFLPVQIEFDGKIVNEHEPIWKKSPTSLKDEDYLEFFKVLYPFAEEPLFWIHLNVDFPFELTGILYFPRIKADIEALRKDRIQLYSRQVFITDSVEDIVPEYLMLLQGVIDSPDIPLNVSRSFLQTDSNVKKISNYISKKVGDKLKELFKEDRDKFAEKWPDMETFVKFGMLSEDKFYDTAIDFCLLKTTDGEYFTKGEFRGSIEEKQTDKDENVVFLYASELDVQDPYIQAAKKRDYQVLHLNGPLDSHFIGMLERKFEKEQWKRIDADSVDKLVPKDEEREAAIGEEEVTKVKELFTELAQDKGITVQTEALGEETMPVVITRPEFMRRMKEMQMMGGQAAMMNMPDMVNAVINTSHPLIVKVSERKTKEAKERLGRQLLDLALLSQGMLNGNHLTEFIERSMSIIR